MEPSVLVKLLLLKDFSISYSTSANCVRKASKWCSSSTNSKSLISYPTVLFSLYLEEETFMMCILQIWTTKVRLASLLKSQVMKASYGITVSLISTPKKIQKLTSKDLVKRLPKLKFEKEKSCKAC